MNKEQYRDDDYLGEEEASKEVGISLALFREANNLYWIRPEYSLTKPPIRELGLPMKNSPDNVATYRVEDLRKLKDRLANTPEDLARLRSLVKE
jgi:hypothetical protein